MALLFADSFDLYNTADIPLKWLGGENGATIQSAVFRTGTQAMLCAGSNVTSESFGDTARLICGFAINNQPQNNQTLAILKFYSSTAGMAPVEIAINGTSSAIQVQVNGSTIATGPTLPIGSWHALGVDATFSNSGSGVVLVYLDGAEVLNLTGLTMGATHADTIILGDRNGSGFTTNFYVDDFFLFNGTGGVNNSYPGDQKVVALVPNGDGRVNQWTPVGTTPNYLCVNEIPPDGDTTYVSDSTLNDEDCYTLAALPAGVSGITAVQMGAFARKDDSTNRAIALGVGNGTTEDFGGDLYLGEAYQYELQPFDTNPLTSAPWGVSDFTTLQAAIKVAV